MKYYLDCEFDGFGGKLLSMGIVAETGKSMYAVLNEPVTEPWVKENVQPYFLDLPTDRIDYLCLGASRAELCSLLESFFKGDEYPFVVSDWPDDIKYLSEALITGPGTMINVPRFGFMLRRVDAYPTELAGARQHNAWWDAMALRHLCEGIDRELYDNAVKRRPVEAV